VLERIRVTEEAGSLLLAKKANRRSKSQQKGSMEVCSYRRMMQYTEEITYRRQTGHRRHPGMVESRKEQTQAGQQ
jgi:hypothetical protein